VDAVPVSRGLASAYDLLMRLMLYALLLLPREGRDPAWDAASLALLLAGHFLCAVTLTQLGRSFSVMPEARLLPSVY
jgi:MFS superfamily sulfate permease-like transporter